jgi:inner membrane protein
MVARGNARRTHETVQVHNVGSQLWRISGAAASLGLILLVDYYFRIASPRLITIAVLDELAHIATALLFLFALWRVINIWFAAGSLVGAVLIDIDHLPALFSTGSLAAHPERPVTHSLVSVIALLFIALVFSGRARAALVGGALGVATHLLRDMATGGVPLLWPVHHAIVDLPYGVYAAMIVALALIPPLRYLRPTIRNSRPAGIPTGDSATN